MEKRLAILASLLALVAGCGSDGKNGNDGAPAQNLLWAGPDGTVIEGSFGASYTSSSRDVQGFVLAADGTLWKLDPRGGNVGVLHVLPVGATAFGIVPLYASTDCTGVPMYYPAAVVPRIPFTFEGGISSQGHVAPDDGMSGSRHAFESYYDSNGLCQLQTGSDTLVTRTELEALPTANAPTGSAGPAHLVSVPAS